MERNHIDIEFKELVAIPDDNGLLPMEVDIANPPEEYVQNGSLDDFLKAYAQGNLQKGSRDSVARSRMESNRNPKPESKPVEEQSVEEFVGECQKRSSDAHKIKLTKRLVDGEILVEGWDAGGECVMTRVVAAGDEIPEDEPLAKASITSSMLKTLAQIRAALTPEEAEAAEKAVRSLDIDAFLQICRRAQAAV